MKENSIYNTIITYIHNGEIEKTIDKIKEILKKKPNESTVSQEFGIIFFRWQTLNKDKGVISYEEYHRIQVQIAGALLSMIHEYQYLFPGDIWLESNPDTDYDNILKELGEELAFNYYSVSFGDRFTGTDANYLKDIFKEEALKQYQKDRSKRRNILLIGAGATVASCPYVPTGRVLKLYLEEKYPDFKEESGDEENDFSNFDTERYLSHLHQKLSDKGKARLRDALNEIYAVRYLPTHFYEIVAHMLKHSFFDVVINFNFDELLDESVAEELGKSSHIKVISSADCRDLEDIFIDGRLKTPVYIKILGTASDKSSLRFTHDNHFDIPPDIKNFIRRWLRGDVPSSPDSKPERVRTNIVCVGFDPVRFNFFRFLKDDSLLPNSKWFHLNYKTRPSFERMGLSQYSIGKDAEGQNYERWIPMVSWKRNKLKDKDNFVIPLVDVFTQLWNIHIRGIFNAPFRPRNIARHEIIADIFYHSFDHKDRNAFMDVASIETKYAEMKGYFRSVRYYFERTVVEVGISLCKNKGIIEPEQVIFERIGHFYQKYVDLFSDPKKAGETWTTVRKPKKPYERTLFTLQDIFDLYQLRSDYHYAGDLLNISKFNEAYDYADDSCFNLIKDLGFSGKQTKMAVFFDDPVNMHLLILYRLFKNPFQMEVIELLMRRCDENTSLKNHIFSRLKENMHHLRNSSTYDIKSRFDDPEILRFQSVNKSHILHTNLSLSYQFAEKFNYPDTWDVMLMVGERSKFLTNHFNVVGENTHDNENFIQSLMGKKMIILACHEAVSEDVDMPELNARSRHSFEPLKTAFKKKSQIDYENIKYYFLPYWQHYYHCVIFLKKREGAPLTNKAHFEVPGRNYVWEVVRSFYYHKAGFSNQINPVLFPTSSNDPTELKRIQKDQTWLMKTFYAYYLMAQVFEKHGNRVPVVNPALSIDPSFTDTSTHADQEARFNEFLYSL